MSLESDIESDIHDCVDYFSIVYYAAHKEELPLFMAKEGAFVVAGKVTAEKMKSELEVVSSAAKTSLEEATKAAEKSQADLNAILAKKAMKEAEAEAAKKVAQKAWLGVAAKKAQVEVLEKSVKILAKEGTELAAKTAAKTAAKSAAKQTAKVAAEASAKTAAKKIPIFSLAVGGFFGAVRVGSGIYNFVQGNTARGFEELGKAPLEVASGAAACFPGVGTAASFGIDAALLGWDVGDAIHDATKDSSTADSPAQILLKYKVLQISEAIDDHKLSNDAFLNEVFKLVFANLKYHANKNEAAKDAAYIYAMVKAVFDSEEFAGKFPTVTIAKKMIEIGFSKVQVDCFRAVAIENKRN